MYRIMGWLKRNPGEILMALLLILIFFAVLITWAG